jgi:hypothetical protein
MRIAANPTNASEGTTANTQREMDMTAHVNWQRWARAILP